MEQPGEAGGSSPAHASEGAPPCQQCGFGLNSTQNPNIPQFCCSVLPWSFAVLGPFWLGLCNGGGTKVRKEWRWRERHIEGQLLSPHPHPDHSWKGSWGDGTMLPCGG